MIANQPCPFKTLNVNSDLAYLYTKPHMQLVDQKRAASSINNQINLMARKCTRGGILAQSKVMPRCSLHFSSKYFHMRRETVACTIDCVWLGGVLVMIYEVFDENDERF